MKGIGETNAKVLKMTTQEEYLQRLRDAYGTHYKSTDEGVYLSRNP